LKPYYFRIFLLLSFFVFSVNGLAQNYYTLKGYVSTASQEILPASSIRVFNLGTGTSSNTEGQYKIRLIEGLNRLTVSHLGYKSQTFEIVMLSDSTKNISLELDQKQLDEVVIKNKKRDYSYEVIKLVIENKGKWLNQYQNYKSEVYIKSTEKSESAKAPKKEKVKTDSIDFETPKKLDSLANISLFECQLTRHETADGRQKEEKTAVKKIGNQRKLFYTSITDGEFNLYKNHLRIPKIGENEITSPFNDLAFFSYKFELIKTFYEGSQKIYHIRVIPRDVGNALYEGEIEIIDELWVLRKADLSLSKRALLLHDSFDIHLKYELADEKYMLTEAKYEWAVKEGGKKYKGQTEVSQKDFTFDMPLPKRFFGDMIGLTTQNAYEKDSTFWANIRPKPLNKEEQAVIKNKEKLDELMNSKVYLDSLDRISNKITFQKIIWSGVTHTNRAKKIDWSFGSLPNLVQVFSPGGIRVQYGVGMYKKFENRTRINTNVNLNYGLQNKDVKGVLFANYLYDPIKQSRVTVRFGTGFGAINNFATIADVAKRSNFYQTKFFFLSHRTEILNGLFTSVGVYRERREDLSNFKFTKLGDQVFTNNIPLPFPTGYVTKTNFGLDYTPRQQYLLEPREKIILGSDFPTFYFDIELANKVFKKDNVKYSFLSAGVKQVRNIGIFGTLEYNLTASRFLDTTQLSPMDYKYVRGGDKRIFSPAMYSFQLIPKTFRVNTWQYQLHAVHQFNGYLTSKIPLLNRTNIKEMVGGGLMYIPETKYQYAELFGGVNRVFKIGRERLRIGAYYVVAQSNQFGIKNGFKFSIEGYNPSKNTWSF
jgi:Family of unknown function (DUF5686)/CarboxypepD_reg-like domain